MNRYQLTFIVLLILIGYTLISYAQIPNASFEQWTSGEPDGWKTSNDPGAIIPVTQTTTSHSGELALRGEMISTFHPPIIQAGKNGKGFAISQRYDAVEGFYQFLPVGLDQIVVNIIMFNNGNAIAEGVIAITEAALSHVPFTVSINYTSDEIPDTCFIKISIIGPMTGGGFHTGSIMLIDDLKFSAPVLIQEYYQTSLAVPEEFLLKQNYPNPFNPITSINFAIPEETDVVLDIFNSAGQKIETLVNKHIDVGHYNVTWDANNLPSGIYFYRIKTSSYTDIKQMILMK